MRGSRASARQMRSGSSGNRLPPSGLYAILLGLTALLIIPLAQGQPLGFGLATSDHSTSARPASSTATWTHISTSVAPSPRDEQTTAFDAKDGYLVVFGGAGPGLLNDTWTFSNGKWTNVTSSVAPPAREGGSMAYDAKDGYVVLFGGYANGTFLGDTWTFSGGVWTNRTSATSPSPRFGQSMVYDATIHRIVLFGGCSSAIAGVRDCTKNVHGDTWTFVGGRWKMLATHVAPPGRKDGSMVYDPALKEAVLFGGIGKNGDLADTWVFNGSAWTAVTAAGTPSVGPTSTACSYVPQLGGAVFFGGGGAHSYGSQTWMFNGTWHQEFPAASPAGRDDPQGMAEGAASTGAILFGGYDGGYLNDTWILT